MSQSNELEVCEQALYLIQMFLKERHNELLPDLADYIEHVVHFDVDLYDDPNRYNYGAKALNGIDSLDGAVERLQMLNKKLR